MKRRHATSWRTLSSIANSSATISRQCRFSKRPGSPTHSMKAFLPCRGRKDFPPLWQNSVTFASGVASRPLNSARHRRHSSRLSRGAATTPRPFDQQPSFRLNGWSSKRARKAIRQHRERPRPAPAGNQDAGCDGPTPSSSHGRLRAYRTHV